MSEMVHQRVLFWVILAVLLGGISWMYLRTAHAPEIPRADLATMETRVREAILADIETLRSDPDQATAWAALAQTYHAHDLFGPAVEAYQQAMQRNDGDSRWPYLAALATTKSDPQAAVPLFERAVALQPANASVYI
ncbi:MAG: hypothetical protein KJO85_01750, partial [Gammaproteobacteria bacterium]|nr:hypothetical protein [Gammaproteobacteria bacterium]